MNRPRLIEPHDRNYSTFIVPDLVHEQSKERSDERRRAETTLQDIEERVRDIEPHQLAACRSVLARDPLATGRAWRLATCPPDSIPLSLGSPVRRYPCRLRCCVYCAERRAKRLARGMNVRTAGYAAPLVVLVTCPSKSLLDLPAALRKLQCALASLRRRRWFSASCRAGAIVVETPLTQDGRRWALHAHGVLEVPGDSPAFRTRCAAEWRALTGIPRAMFDFEAARSVPSLIAYALKVGDAKTWTPSARELSPQLMAHLDAALGGRRLVLAWPNAARKTMS